MCFIPFLATKSVPVTVPRTESHPGTTLNPLQDQYAAVRDKFSLPHVTEINLVIGCGCWLRHVDDSTSADMDDHVEWNISQPTYNPATEQPNHEGLADFLEANFRQDGFVEFFAYFNGDASQPARARKELPVSAIRHPYFHFHGGTLYRFTFD
jgi:hypothetical protein